MECQKYKKCSSSLVPNPNNETIALEEYERKNKKRSTNYYKI
jgi:hypothetical protein